MYGNNPLYELELFGSVLSAISHNDTDEIEVTVFSDRDTIEGFPFPVRVIKVSTKEWNKWTYNGTATHFIKMHAMEYMLSEKIGPVLYFDTDVIFMSPPSAIMEKIRTDQTLMHACEGPIIEHSFWENFLNDIHSKGLSFNLNITPTSSMYNSGIMGMLPEHSPIMKEAITLATEIFRCEPIFSIDQFATGTALSNSTTLTTCEQEVFHYWGWKRKFIHIELKKIRTAWKAKALSDEMLIKTFNSLSDIPKIHFIDKIKACLFYRLKPNHDNYRFAFLAYLSAKRHASSNITLANIWIMTCLNIFLRKLEFGAISKTTPNSIYYLIPLANSRPAWLNQQSLDCLQQIIVKVSKT
jgi:hypothetical protein